MTRIIVPTVRYVRSGDVCVVVAVAAVAAVANAAVFNMVCAPPFIASAA